MMLICLALFNYFLGIENLESKYCHNYYFLIFSIKSLECFNFFFNINYFSDILYF